MDVDEMKAAIRNIDERTSRIEQILPTLSTNVREEGERTRLHFDVVAEDLKSSIEAIAEGHDVTKTHVEGVRTELKTDIAAHDRRITKLEASAAKHRQS